MRVKIKHILLAFFIFFCCTALAQKLIVTGEFKQNYNSLWLSDNIQRVLFLLEKGNIDLPDSKGYYLKLSPKDAQILGRERIWVMSFIRGIDLIYDTPITFELYPIPYVSGGYYTKKVTYTDESGKRVTETYKHATPFNELSESKLSSEEWFLRRLLPFPLPEYPTQKDWEKCWEQWQNYPLPILQDLPVHKEIFENNINMEVIYALDSYTHKVYSLPVKPAYINGGEQVLMFDTQKNQVKRGTTWAREQPEADNFNTLYVERDTLYTFTDKFVWAKYVPEPKGDKLFYRQIALANRSLEVGKSCAKVPDKEMGYSVSYTYATHDYMYILVRKSNTGEYQLLIIDTRTGRSQALISVNALLRNPKELENYMGYIAAENFAILMRTEKGVYHLKFNGSKLIEKIFLGKDFRRGATYLSWGQKQCYGDITSDTTFDFYTITSPSKEHRVSLRDKSYDTKEIAHDKDAIVAFYEYYDGFFSGLKMQHLDKDTQALKGESTLLYQYFPVEEWKHLKSLKVFKINGQWHAFFVKGNEYFWVKAE